MLKLIVGLKGSGKTKTLIDMVNTSLEKTNGNVVCVEKGTKLIHEIKYQARLVDTDEYFVQNAESLCGFISGIYASNHDVTDIFVDSALKICNNDVAAFASLIEKVNAFAEQHAIHIVMTASIASADLPEQIKKFVIEH
ncbi:MAG: hypothetical protein E7655_09350 [Ruminococcaceae bacterium]|nr:hypothetical protein [Oscillospiraceae bacterium]